jgi:hypothetical protein
LDCYKVRLPPVRIASFLLVHFLLPGELKPYFFGVQKHSGNCTESFYRENVVDVMKGQRATAQEQQQMAKILRRVHQADAPTEGTRSMQ